MTERIVRIPTAQVSREISDFTIGLAKLTAQDRVEDASCAGTGTLITIDHVDGLLTAAHVLDALPDNGEVGVILYRDSALQKHTIEMEHSEKLYIRGEKFGLSGPDLGFLRLPPKNIGWLKAIGSFYNLGKRRGAVLGDENPTPNSVDAAIGMIDEFTKELPAEKPLRRAKAFSAIFCNGAVRSERNEGGFDFLDFAITSDPDFKLPNDFEGMSGGALWRFYFVEKDNLPVIIEKRLIGIPFYQSKAKDGTRIITCHGPKGVYGTLIDKISARWPEQASFRN